MKQVDNVSLGIGILGICVLVALSILAAVEHVQVSPVTIGAAVTAVAALVAALRGQANGGPPSGSGNGKGA